MSTVVLIEDNVDNRAVIEDIFEFDVEGLDLAIATTAEEGLALVRSRRPDLVLMDLGLPGMSGLEATRRLKADPETARVPIWALTAHAMKEFRSRALEAGCAAYVTKPIDAGDLVERLGAFLAQIRSSEIA